jgi:endo-1,4-beta-xylanase
MGLHVGNVVKWFNDQGIVVFGLKYRTKYGANAVADDAVADCARAVRLIRQQSEAWGIKRLGVQGYSAGGNIGLNLLGRFDAGNAQSADPVERFSSRPDFIALMCPWPNGKPIHQYPVNPTPPPVFIASADDKTATTAFALEIAEAVRKQGGSVQMFVVPTGGHSAFHYGVAKGPGAQWPSALLSMLNKQ